MALNDSIKNMITTDLPKIDAAASVKNAIELMGRHGTCALAVETTGEVIGVITDLDLAGALVNGSKPEEMMVAEFMTACDLITGRGATRPCVQLDEDETVENALKLLASTGVHNLMVSGVGDHFRGIVSTCDLLRAAVN